MKKSLLALAIILGFGSSVVAQKQTGEIPFSWKGKMSVPDHNIETVNMPLLNMSQIHAEDAINDASGNVQRMTVFQDVNLDINNSGTWFQLPNGDKVWKLKIKSYNAMGIVLLFENWDMPVGSKLHVYNEAHTDLLGAFTHENNKSHGQMTIQHILGDVAILELYQPGGFSTYTPFTISSVGHAYRQLYRGPNQTGAMQLGSDPCEVDVNCSEGNNWQDQKKGACRIFVVSPQGGGWCSGSLINNTAQDCKPYILTALHCGETSTTANLNNYVFYFNYESSGCGTGSAPTNQSLTGCTKIADSGDGGGNSGSDYLLVECNAANASNTLNGYGAFWNGWNAVNSGSPSGVSIHHPAGDRKKISTYTSTLTTTGWGIGGTHWQVDWVGTANGHGVTEGGSSGSPIFDNNKRIVGQLTGGSSFCSQVPNTSPDAYGKMSYNWASNPGDDLRDFLDPLNSGATTLDGVYYPCTPASPDDAGITSIDAPAGTSCGASFSPIVTLRNYGSAALTSVTINYQLDGGTVQTFPWTGNLAAGASTSVTLPTVSTSAGSHTFDAYTTLPNGVTDGNPANDAASQVNFTVNPNGVQVDFTLITDCWGSETTWEVVDAQQNVVYSGGPYQDVAGGETITEVWCLTSGCYDFIIYDSYGDGMFGSQWQTCTVDGSYSIDDPNSGSNLASIIAANSDFGNQETNNFCVNTTLTSLFTTNNPTVCAGSTVVFTDQSSGNPTSWDWTFPGGSPASSTQQNPSVTYNTPGTYDVTLVVGDGQTTSSSTLNGYITVVPVPTGTVSATDESCSGACDGTVTANITGGTPPYSYGWSGGIGTTATVNNVCAGTYNLVLTDDNGCVLSGLSATVGSGAASPVPGFTASSNPVYLSAGGQVTFTNTSTGATSYDWDFGDGNTSTATDPTHTYTAVGTYLVTLTANNTNGCSAQTQMSIQVLQESSIQDPALAEAINMYPNPTNGQLTVDVDVPDAKEVFVEIYNDIGKLVAVVPATAGEQTIRINMSTLARGLYFVAVHVDGKMVVDKVSLTD